MIKMIERKGFTLLELIIVIVIIGILASLAMPRFIRTAERSRAAEALAQVGAVRGSMQRYYASDQSYTGATFARLDVDDPNDATLYPLRLFSYVLTVTDATHFTVTATRNATKSGDGSSTITIDQDGGITGTGVFAGIK